MKTSAYGALFGCFLKQSPLILIEIAGHIEEKHQPADTAIGRLPP
jgi:hypothetical protein